MLIREDEYTARRRAATTSDIASAKGSRKKLEGMLKKRRMLARVYAEDGAVSTAKIIETVDIALIESALKI